MFKKLTKPMLCVAVLVVIATGVNADNRYEIGTSCSRSAVIRLAKSGCICKVFGHRMHRQISMCVVCGRHAFDGEE